MPFGLRGLHPQHQKRKEPAHHPFQSLLPYRLDSTQGLACVDQPCQRSKRAPRKLRPRSKTFWLRKQICWHTKHRYSRMLLLLVLIVCSPILSCLTLGRITSSCVSCLRTFALFDCTNTCITSVRVDTDLFQQKIGRPSCSHSSRGITKP